MKKILWSILLIVSTSFLEANNLCDNSTFDVTNYGALGDGETINTKAIQQAIDDCFSNGGGLVYFPDGVFVTGTIRLKSNVTLHLSNQAVIKGSANINDYPLHSASHKFAFYTSTNTMNADLIALRSLIWSDEAQNIGIIGQGTIDGNGGHDVFKHKKGLIRPLVLRFISSNQVKIEGVTLKNSASWMQMYLNCDDVNIDRITVYNHAQKNNDGLDIVGSRNVKITNCNINADDDGICLKTLSEATCQNILISGCHIQSNCNAIKIGTESVSDFRNIIITDCIISKSSVRSKTWARDIGLAGVALETVDGGQVENVVVSNIISTGTYSPLFIRLGNRGRSPIPNQVAPVGKMNDIYITNFVGVAERRPELSITGIPNHYIDGLTLQNVNIKAKGDAKASKKEVFREVPEVEKEYPEVLMFGKMLPAYGMYIRHVKNLNFDNLKLEYDIEDVRPALFMDDVVGADIASLMVEDNVKSTSSLHFKNCQNIALDNSMTSYNAPHFLFVDGEKTKNIRVQNTFDFKSRDFLYLSKNVDKNQVLQN